MKMTQARKLQYAQQALAKERAMREILQNVDPQAAIDHKVRLAEAKRLHGTYSVHAICDALKIPRGTFYNHIFRSKEDDNLNLSLATFKKTDLYIMLLVVVIFSVFLNNIVLLTATLNK